MSLQPEASVIVVTFNSSHVIRECLRPLAGQPGIEIIVVDNASSDDTKHIVATEFSQVRLISRSSNAGFSKAVNEAASLALGENLLLLNPDAVISMESLRNLLDQFASDPLLGACAPLVSDPQSEFRTIGAGRAPTIWRMLLHASGASRLSSRISALEGHYLFPFNLPPRTRYVDWATGGCLLVRRNVWEELKGLNERWFMYAEDIDFCLRIRKVGRRVGLVPSAHALHEVGGSSSTVDGRVNDAWIINLFDLYSTYMAPTATHAAVWKYTVWCGFRGRALAYSVISRSREDPHLALANARRFKSYAAALRSQKTVRT